MNIETAQILARQDAAHAAKATGRRIVAAGSLNMLTLPGAKKVRRSADDDLWDAYCDAFHAAAATTVPIGWE